MTKIELVEKLAEKIFTAIGRYYSEPSTILFTKPFEGRRKSYERHMPEYNVTAMGFHVGERIGKPFGGQDIWFGRKRNKA